MSGTVTDYSMKKLGGGSISSPITNIGSHLVSQIDLNNIQIAAIVQINWASMIFTNSIHRNVQKSFSNTHLSAKTLPSKNSTSM
jgi:hypothetical protein